jgi:STE24 endopeptidase
LGVGIATDRNGGVGPQRRLVAAYGLAKTDILARHSGVVKDGEDSFMQPTSMIRARHLAVLAGLSVVLSASPARSLAAQGGPGSTVPPAAGLAILGDAPTPAASAQSPALNTPDRPDKTITAYTLPPELYPKARNFSKIRYRLYLVDFVWSVVALLFVLGARLAAKFRDVAERFTQNRLLQAAIFTPAILVTVDVLQLPPGIYGQWLSRAYGLSVQGWKSWARDWAVGELLACALGILLVWILYALIRRTARRWWFYFWLATLPILIFILFISPWVIDPLFYKFEPLQLHQAELAAKLEQVVQRGGMNIPVDRMYEMNASTKVNELNAYVTGFGASKRVVVWDTTIAKMNPQQIAAVFGHEMGHYVLYHIPKGMAFFSLLLLLLSYVAWRASGSIIRSRGASLGIRGEEDCASLPVFLLVLTLLAFLASPIVNGFTRIQEHHADIYALEITHGLTPDSGQVVGQVFQILGEVDLADPDPPALARFWLYSHPPIGERVDFAIHYDPWANGASPQFVK